METVKALVVDDEPGIAALCKRVLSRAGYDVVALTDPRAAIEHLQQHRLDLLVVDIRMPDVDGGLIGGASLKAEEFLAIWSAAAEVQ